MNPSIRSILLAVVFGMMAAAFLDERGIVDLSFGFTDGGVEEGVFMALIGGLGGYAILLAFRILKGLSNHSKGE